MLRFTHNFPGADLIIRLALGMIFSFCFSISALAFEFGPLKGEVWGAGNRALIVILHGDGGPGRYDGFADRLARTYKNTTVVTLNRPGYGRKGLRSPGSSGGGRDHYTKRNNDLLAQTLSDMKSRLNPRRMIVIGHSGGSGQLGSIIGRYPGVVPVAILGACPCDVPRWRVSRRGSNQWTSSQSPLDYVATISRKTKVYAVTGLRDGNTKPKFARAYVALARQHGKNATLIEPPKGTHSWRTIEPAVADIIRKELK